MQKALFFGLVFSVLSSFAHADTHFGLAMVGAPKYTAEDTHLDYANPDAPKGGTLRQASIGTFDTLNPFTIKGKAADGLNLVYDKLMARVWDEPFTMYPLIAERVDVPEDRSSITFHLNPKAVFHDGTPITADDVLFSYETLKEHGRPNQRRIYKLATPKILGERAIKFSFGEGYDRETAMIFTLMPVLSKAYWSEHEFNTTTLDPPLGSGPYKILSVDPGRKITYERVPDYWAKDLLVNKGHHNFDKIVFDYYRDSSVALEAFKSGELDLWREWDAGNWNNAYDFPDVHNGKVKKETLKHGRPDRVRGFIFNTRRAPFDDIRVRQALNLLFDFDWVNKNLFHGAYERIDSFYPNTDLAYKEDNAPAPLAGRAAMRKADELLKQAGWIVQDGKRINDQTGKELTFDILVDDPSQEKIALALVNNLKRMGITPRVRTLDTAAFRDRLNAYDFDMILYYWNATLSPGTEQMLYWSCESAKAEGRWNFAGICDPSIDALAEKIPTAKSREELHSYTQALDKKLLEGQFMIPLYYNPKDYVAYRPPVTRPDTVPLYGMVVETWWMSP